MTTSPLPLTAVAKALGPNRMKTEAPQLPAEQTSPAPHAWAGGITHAPAEQVPGPTNVVGDAQLATPHDLVGNEHTPLAPQVPPQVVLLRAQSALVQQFADGMQARPHCFEPVLHAYEHR